MFPFRQNHSGSGKEGSKDALQDRKRGLQFVHSRSSPRLRPFHSKISRLSPPQTSASLRGGSFAPVVAECSMLYTITIEPVLWRRRVCLKLRRELFCRLPTQIPVFSLLSIHLVQARKCWSWGSPLLGWVDFQAGEQKIVRKS
jgi:hypothetical protein